MNSTKLSSPKSPLKPVVIVKLGGSVITDKSQALTPNTHNITRLVQELAESIKTENISLIVVHGGGSYGHPLANRYHLDQGLKDISQLLGFAETHQSMLALNKLVIEEFVEHKLPAVSFPAMNMWTTKDGRIAEGSPTQVEDALRRGFIPVLFGDTVFDSTRGVAILSGDQIINYLVKPLKPKMVIIGTDVDGLFTADPKTHPTARFIPKLTSQNVDPVLKGLEGAKVVDVTGGMRAKVTELLEIASYTPKIILVNADIPDRIKLAVCDKPVRGTIISHR